MLLLSTAEGNSKGASAVNFNPNKFQSLPQEVSKVVLVNSSVAKLYNTNLD